MTLSRPLTYFLILCAFLMLGTGVLFSAAKAENQEPPKTAEAEEAVKQEPPKRRPPFDLNKLPDPFVSYIIRKQRNELLDRERERKEQLEREARMKKEQIEAERKLQELLEQKTDLQKLELSQLTLTAVVKGKEKDWAMVRDPRGMGHILKKGLAIGTKGGVVKKIAYDERRVVIDEPYLTKDYKLAFKEVELSMKDELFE